MEPDRWLGVELRHLAALQAVSEEGGFGRAAARLGYTQSAVSQQIATLERLVGERLVERPGGPRPVSITEAGMVLLRHADGIIARLRAAQADLAALQNGTAGALRVGTYQSVGARVLPEVMLRFSTAHPHVDVQLSESEDGALLRQVEAGDRPQFHPAASPRGAVRGDRAAARSAHAGGAGRVAAGVGAAPVAARGGRDAVDQLPHLHLGPPGRVAASDARQLAGDRIPLR
jgi:DNA-binding transcriptional LysR family regulator